MSDTTNNGLEGSRCQECGNVAYPVAVGCQRCGRDAMEAIDLDRRGIVWGFTVQRFAPKSPYVPPAEGFTPFAVGYVELPDGIKVEAILRCTDFAELEDHARVSLVAIAPVPHFATDSFLEAN